MTAREEEEKQEGRIKFMAQYSIAAGRDGYLLSEYQHAS